MYLIYHLLIQMFEPGAVLTAYLVFYIRTVVSISHHTDSARLTDEEPLLEHYAQSSCVVDIPFHHCMM